MKIKTGIESAYIAVSGRTFRARVAVAMLGIATAVLSLMADDGSGTASAEATAAIRSFHINIPEEALVDLRQRIGATRWPEKETVTDQSQGVRLATMQALARYWVTDYDWRKCEAKLNALPQFVTEIDGLNIHFIQVRSRHPNALPVIITHGWPGSVIEQLKVIGPLTDPTAYGGRAEDAFDVVIPLHARVWLLKQADHGWLGPGPHRTRVDRFDETPRIHALCGARRRLGGCCLGADGSTGATGITRHSRQHACYRSSRRCKGAPIQRASANRSLG